MSPEKSGGGSSRERSFQEHLAATMRKYQGERRRLVRRTVDSCHEKLCRYCGHGAYTARYETICSVVEAIVFLQRPSLLSRFVSCRKTIRHPQSTARSCTESVEQQRRVHWNTEMLSYTVYAADECGKVTTWDLKAVLVSLIHM